jgi:hypothetical protein
VVIAAAPEGHITIKAAEKGRFQQKHAFKMEGKFFSDLI